MKRNYVIPAIVAAVLATIALTVPGLASWSGDGERDQPRRDETAPVAETTTESVPADPCTLITKAEAANTLGAEVSAAPSGGQCTYVAMDSSGRALAVSAPALAGSAAEFEAGVGQAAQALGGSYQPLSVGDEAYAITSPSVAEALGRTGQSYAVVVLTGASGDPTTTLRELLGTALSRL